MGKILLVRHGSTKLNKDSAGDSNERIRGWADVPLDDKGEAQAKAAADLIASKFKPNCIYSSPLVRAYITARDIAKATGVKEIYKTLDLTPWHLGDMTGQKVADIIPEMKAHIINESKSVPGGEPFSIFRRRFLGFLKDQISEARKDDLQIVLVCHTRNCQLARAWIANDCPDDLSIDKKVMDDYSGEISPGGIFVLEL